MKWFLNLFKKNCSHFDARYEFVGYHTAYRTQSSSVFDIVYIIESAKCHECGEKLFRIAGVPPKLTELFFANFKACMSEAPAVISNKKKESESGS